MKIREFIPTGEDFGKRLDKFLVEACGDLTRSYLSNLIQDGNVVVNGISSSKNYRLKHGDKIELSIPLQVNPVVLAEDIPLDIVFEDEDLLVVNKPKGMVVHPAVGNYSGTLVNALLNHCGGNLSTINGEFRSGIVHRLDKNTSGLLLVAKNDFIHEGLAEQLKNRTLLRVYEGIVNGSIKEGATVNLPIGRHKVNRKKMAVSQGNSRDAITHYEVVENYPHHTHLKIQLETGRTHQIRVHMAHIGHPITGDDVYGNGKPKWLCGQCLHSKKLGFVHPRSGEYKEIESPLPDYFVRLIRLVSK